jgi:hypothetical protein
MVEAGKQCRRCRHYMGMEPLGATIAAEELLVPTCDAFPHPASRIDEILPHNWTPPEAKPSA